MRDLMPEELRRRLFARPQLLHGVCVPEFTVFRDPMNFDRIVNVIEWVGVEHYEIGEFADFDGAQVRRKSELLGGQQRRGTERLHRSHRKVTLRGPSPAIAHSSQCGPSPCSWPCAPSDTLPPARKTSAAPCATMGNQYSVGQIQGWRRAMRSSESWGTKRLSFASSCGLAVCQ